MDSAEQADSSLSEASSLCVSCGMCCTGILYTHAPCDPAETPRMRALGMTIGHVGERPHFTLPCPHHYDGHCGIYAERFGKCRSFRCELLKRLDAGAVTLAEARGHVDTARTMVGRLAAFAPGADQAGARNTLRAQGAPGPKQARLWVESLALDTFLDRHFRKGNAIAWPDAAADRLAKE